MTTKEALEAARDLISDPKRWTTGYFAKKADGEITASRKPDAVCWCASGAVNRICGDNYPLGQQVTNALALVMGIVVDFNDNSPHEDVLAAFDIAICLES